MKTFIGTKVIRAVAMTRAAYNEFRGWKLPYNENVEAEGYLVEYKDCEEPNIPTHEGYVSWSPKKQFENDYRETNGLSFGLAVEAIKKGSKIARSGWNGKGMFVYYVPARNYPVQIGATESHFGEGSLVPYNAYMAIKNVDNTVSTWVPSVNDVLADDWQIV